MTGNTDWNPIPDPENSRSYVKEGRQWDSVASRYFVLTVRHCDALKQMKRLAANGSQSGLPHSWHWHTGSLQDRHFLHSRAALRCADPRTLYLINSLPHSLEAMLPTTSAAQCSRRLTASGQQTAVTVYLRVLPWICLYHSLLLFWCSSSLRF